MKDPEGRFFECQKFLLCIIGVGVHSTQPLHSWRAPNHNRRIYAPPWQKIEWASKMEEIDCEPSLATAVLCPGSLWEGWTVMTLTSALLVNALIIIDSPPRTLVVRRHSMDTNVTSYCCSRVRHIIRRTAIVWMSTILSSSVWEIGGLYSRSTAFVSL